MKTLSALKKADPVKYNDRLVRFIAAPLAAHFIISFDEKETVLELLQLKEYYIALAFNTLIAIIVIESIAWAQRVLDKKYPWMVFPLKRLLHQVIRAILIPLALSVVAAIVYFGCYHIPIFDTVYFDQYFLIIVLMIIIVNCYYFIHFTVRMMFLVVEFSKRSKNIKINNQPLSHVLKWPTYDIALVFRDNLGTFVLTSENEKLIWPDTLGNTILNLPAVDYFMINRSEIVRADVIEKADMSSSRRIMLTLKPPLDRIVYVSQRQSYEFKEWWQQQSEPLL